MMPLIDNYFLPGSLWLIMFSMGLSLTISDFKLVLKQKKALLVGLVCMLFVPAVIGVSVAVFFAPMFFELTPALTVGFILLATCPGGMLSNLMTDLAKGDLALSLSMSIIVSMIYIAVVPFYAHYALLLFMDVSEQVSVPLLSFIWKIFSITLIPVSLGLLARACWPDFCIKYKGMVKILGTVVLFVSFGFIIADQVPTLRQYLDSLFLITLAINFVTLLIAIFIGLIMKLKLKERVAIGIEHLIRQEGTAIYIAVTIVGSREMSLPMIMNTPVALFICILFVLWSRSQFKQQSVEHITVN